MSGARSTRVNVFLASDKAKIITGVLLPVDGRCVAK
jgi:hypothetical protein